MARPSHPSLIGIACALTWSAMMATAAGAQNIRTLDISPNDSSKPCYTDSALDAAIAAFNRSSTVRQFGGAVSLASGQIVTGTYGVHDGSLRVDGTLRGDLVVFTGDVHVTGTGVVTGSVTIFGGHLATDPGATIGGPSQVCAQIAHLMRSRDNTLQRRPPTRSITAIASGIAVRAGGITLSPHLGLEPYNRVEGLPIDLGVRTSTALGSRDTVRTDAFVTLRTARDPVGNRPAVGWQASAVFSSGRSTWYAIGVTGQSEIVPLADMSASPHQSGLGALVFRRDYTDWMLKRGIGVFARLRPTPELSTTLSFEQARQSTVLAVDAISILRNTEPWRPNPLIDDGIYRTVAARLTLDARDERSHPVLSWYGNLIVRRITSHHLTPVSLPAAIRDPLPATRYGTTDFDLDVRGYLRLNPESRLDGRLVAGGYVGGDPLTIQRRRAIGGIDPLPGYDFRAVHCDSRHNNPDPSRPALCDRMMAVQLQYRYQLPVSVEARVGGIGVGIRHPELVLLADAGSAWLVGNSPGRVPADRIQALDEWKSDFGVGVTTPWLGLYLVKSYADAIPPRVRVYFHARF